MRALKGFTAAVIVATSLSCSARRYSPVEVSAADFDVSALVGRWAGEYHSDETGRSGNITFTLQPGEASAFGDVMMIPKTATRSAVPLQNQVVGYPAPWERS